MQYWTSDTRRAAVTVHGWDEEQQILNLPDEVAEALWAGEASSFADPVSGETLMFARNW